MKERKKERGNEGSFLQERARAPCNLEDCGCAEGREWNIDNLENGITVQGKIGN